MTDDGVALFDSPVICEYLDSLGDALPMFPAHGAARWRALKLQAMGDGILDAAVPRRGELAKPQDAGRVALHGAAESGGRSHAGRAGGGSAASAVDIGSIAVACALGYLDFRFPRSPGAEGAEAGRVVRGVRADPGIAKTMPKDAA